MTCLAITFTADPEEWRVEECSGAGDVVEGARGDDGGGVNTQNKLITGAFEFDSKSLFDNL